VIIITAMHAASPYVALYTTNPNLTFHILIKPVKSDLTKHSLTQPDPTWPSIFFGGGGELRMAVKEEFVSPRDPAFLENLSDIFL